MTRRATASGVMALLAALLALDVVTSAPLDPFAAPALLALGSGEAASGALCAALPPTD